MVGNEPIVEGGGQLVKSVELLALQFGLLYGEDLRVERLFELQEMPEDVRQVDSLAPARSALRAFASDEFLPRLPKPLKCAPWR